MFPIRAASMILSVAFIVMLVQTPVIESYVATVKNHQSIQVFHYLDEENPLFERVKNEAPKHYIKPIDSRIDRVWKAIPGLNGREVNIEETVKRTLQQKDQTKIAWVYREIPPRVSLSDLGAQPIYRGNEQKKAVALMVNVAWGTEYIPAMLKILKEENVKATFFLDGSWLKKNPDIARSIIKEGHEIGNHAYSHPLMSRISRNQMEKEIGQTESLIEKTLNTKSKWFAPPAGDFNRLVCEVAFRHHMQTVLWTVDTVDWRKNVSPEMMVTKVERELGPGHLLLTHPTDRTVKALKQILRAGKRKGLKWTTVGEVLSSKRVD
ncbi:MAG: polysaccharide deacetylase family protein [Thermoactinomyces sp.]